MKAIGLLIVTVGYLPLAWSANMIPGNAARGAIVLKEKRCLECHSVSGVGGSTAPDLATNPGGRFTPAILAREIWNHGPKMWAAMGEAGRTKPEMSHQEAADVFAYLYTFRYGEAPGDPALGKDLFDKRGCIGCHSQGVSGAPAVMSWQSLNDPIELARAMWNHAPMMSAAMESGQSWPTLTGQELTHLLSYVRRDPDAPRVPATFAPASAETGEVLFKVKGCLSCHTGPSSLIGQGGARSEADLAAAMWNHAPKMRESAETLRPEEMKRLVGYLWSIQYFDGAGDAAKGLTVAATYECIACHGDPSGDTPRFSSFSGKMDAIRFISGAWNHASGMQEAMKKAGVEWPQLKQTEINDVLAYIDSL